jgi:hypothetical protein
MVVRPRRVLRASFLPPRLFLVLIRLILLMGVVGQNWLSATFPTYMIHLRLTHVRIMTMGVFQIRGPLPTRLGPAQTTQILKIQTTAMAIMSLITRVRCMP